MDGVLTAVGVVAPGGVVDVRMVAVLKALAADKAAVGVVSNHAQPSWWADNFADEDEVYFIPAQGRQSGGLIRDISEEHDLKPHDWLVIGASRADLAMAKNGGAVFMSAQWCADEVIATYGLRLDAPDELSELFELMDAWSGGWWFCASGAGYDVKALSNVSSKYVAADQATWGLRVTNTVKHGGTRLKALLAVVARSLLVWGAADLKHPLFAVYPSSSSQNDDTEVLSDFGHRLRSVVSRGRLAKKGEPLFIRHKASPKRSWGGTRGPGVQLETLQINPYYRKGTRLSGRNVVLLDDCVTFGDSFAAASALLLRAGAASVTCVALGKFGRVTRSHSIQVTGDPFAPLDASDYVIRNSTQLHGTEDPMAQDSLLHLIT